MSIQIVLAATMYVWLGWVGMTVAATPVTRSLDKGEVGALAKRIHDRRAASEGWSAEFTEERVSRLLAQPVTSQGTIQFKAPGMLRREVKGAAPSTTVCNGKVLWIFYPVFNTAEKYVLGQKSFFEDAFAAATAGISFSDVERYFAVSGKQGDSGWELRLDPKTGGMRRFLKSITVQISPELELVETVADLPKGDRVTTRYRNPRTITAESSRFEFTPGPGVTVTEPLNGSR
jgi:outer membrane lipoprotein-sorting protein